MPSIRLVERVGAAPPPAAYPWPVMEFTSNALAGWRILLPGRDAHGRPVDAYADRVWLVAGEGGHVDARTLSQGLGCGRAPLQEPLQGAAEAGFSDTWVDGDTVLPSTEGTTWRLGSPTLRALIYSGFGLGARGGRLSRTMMEVRPWPPPCLTLRSSDASPP
ncbi:MAG: hypothetical protein FJY99_00845 [Candidatus Sericytochromatia bacterium]|nr:hypothetical protein [Candidatus Tanganyikabacteria bacterium]